MDSGDIATSHTVKRIEESEATPIAIEPNVVINGMKNPICSVIVGFSGKQTYEGLKRLHKQVMQVIIIEPSLTIFKQACERAYVGDMIADENVELIVGIPPEQLLPHLVACFSKVGSKGSVAHQCFAPEITFDPFVYLDGNKPVPMAQEIANQVKEAAKLIQVSMGCASDSHYRYEQLIKNEKNLENSYRVAPLFEKFKDTAVIVLGAGPSLDEFLAAASDFEKKTGKPITDQALVIAADAGLRKLLDHGIKPHMVTRCERKFTRIFSNISKDDTKGIYFAAYPWVAPDFFDLFDEKIMLYRGNGVCKFSRPFDFGDVDGGVSAANAGLELAFLFKAKEIYLSGVDLVFIDNKSHCEGTQVEFDPENSKAKWTEILLNNGDKGTTIPVWKRCHSEYQSAIHKHKGVVFNTSLKGAFISGTRPIGWEESLDRLISHAPKEKPLTVIKKYLEKHPPGYMVSFQEKKKTAVKILEQARDDLDKLFKSLDDYVLINGREEQKCIGQLKTYSESMDFWKTTDQLVTSMTQVYSRPAGEIDAWKQKYYSNDLFAQMILDICMIDLNSAEHKLASLKNLMKRDHERLKFYVGIHKTLFMTYYFYIEQMISLLKNGANQSVRYHNIEVEGIAALPPGGEPIENPVEYAYGASL